MADKSVGELIAAQSVTPTDLFVLEQNGTAKKLTGQILENWLVSFADGHGGIQSIAKLSTSGLVDTYRITLADTTTFDFVVNNGRGIIGISKTSTSGLVDTYTISYNNGTTSTFTVKNGEKGDKGDNAYTWIKYASQQPTAASHSMGDIPDAWMGIYTGTLAAAPTDWTQYKWYRVRGDQGATGAPATLTGRSVTYMASDSGTVVPSGSWSSDVPTVKQGRYLWTRVVLTFNSGSPVTYYSVSRFGIDGSGAVSSVNGKNPDPAGNVRVNAEDITTTAGTSVEAALAQKQEQLTAGAGVQISGTKVSTAAAPRNWLDNSDFTNLVAQAGISGKHGSVVYAADRWKLTSGTVTYTAGTGLKLNGTITQVLEKAPTGGSCFVGMASGTATIALNGNIITITSSGGVIKWAALYEGAYTAANRPEYQPKGYAAELAECRRYYLNGAFAVTIGAQYGDSKSIFSICIDEMRVIPSATITDVIAQGWGDVTKSDYIQDWAGKIGSKVYYNFINKNNAKDTGKIVVISATFSADL